MALLWLDKLRGPFVQDNGIQIPGTGRIGTLNFTNAALTFDEATGILTIAFDVTSALPDMATDRLLGRDTAGTGPVESITVTGGLEFTGTGGIQRSALTGDITASAGSNATTIANNAVTNSKIRDSAALSVIGRSTASSGDPADISASNDGEVLRRSGSTLGFGTIATAGIGDQQVTFVKLQNIATDKLLGRDTTGSGSVEEITVGVGIEFTGTGTLQRSALTGDVTASAGSNATTIANDAVTNAKLRNSVGTSVIGRAAGTTGDPDDIVASADNTFLGRVAGTLQFVTIDTTVDNLPLANLEDIATDRLLGRDTAGTGVVEVLTVSGGIEFTGSGGIQRSALTGDVTASAGSNSITINNDAITDAKLRNSTATSVIGRSAGTSGDPADIAASADNQFLGRVGGILQFTTITAGSIPNGSVTIDKLQDIATDRLLGRDSAGTGPVEVLTVTGGLEFTGSTGIQRSALTGDITASAGSNTTTIANNAVTDAKLRDSAANTIIGRAAGTSGDPADIAAGTDTVLGRNGSNNLAFTQVQTGMIASTAVTFAKIQNITTDRLLGRDTALSGSVEELTVSGGIEFTGTGGIQRSALTGDVTSSAGSNATTIANDIVTDAKLRNSAALSVIGRSANSIGDPADIVAGNDGEVLRRSGTTLGFGTIVTASISNSQITFVKIQDIPTDTLIGRDSAGTGVPESISVTGGIEFNGTGSIRVGAYTGDVTKTAGGTTLTIGTGAVTYSKIQNVTASNRVLGRITAGAGVVEELTGTDVTSLLDLATTTTKGLVSASGGGTANFYRADNIWAVPPGTWNQPVNVTDDGKLAFANAGNLSYTSNIRTDGTSIRFGTNFSTIGLLAVAHSVTVIAGRDSANATNRVLMAWGTGTNALQLGAGAGAANAVDALYLEVASGGTQYLRFAGNTKYSFTDSVADFGTSILQFSSSATVGTIRLPNTGSIQWLNAAGTNNIVGISVLADNVVRIGNGNNSEIDLNAANFVDVIINSLDRARFSSTTFDLQALVVQMGTNPAQSGLFRLPANPGSGTTFLVARNNANTGDVNLITWNISTANRLTFGSTGVSESYFNIATSGTYNFQINGTTELTISSTTVDFKDNVIQFGTNPADSGLIRIPNNSAGLVARNAANTGNVVAITVDSSNVVVLGGAGTPGAARVYANATSNFTIAINGVDEFIYSSTVADFKDNILQFGTNPSTSGIIRFSNNVVILSARNAANTGNLDLISTDNADGYTIGNQNQIANIYYQIKTGGVHDFRINNVSKFIFRSTELDVTNTNIVQTNISDASSQIFRIRSAGSTSSNNTGADLCLSGGRKGPSLGGGYSSTKIQLNVDDSTYYTMIETRSFLNRRIVSLCLGADLSSTNMPGASGDLVIFIGDTATAPTANPSGGGILYSESGALKWRSPSGTISTLGPAEPHCPNCGRDFALEWKNDKSGELSVCVYCWVDACEEAGIHPEDFVIKKKAA